MRHILVFLMFLMGYLGATMGRTYGRRTGTIQRLPTSAPRHHHSSRQTVSGSCANRCASPLGLAQTCGNGNTTACVQACQQANYNALVDCYVCDINATPASSQSAVLDSHNSMLLSIASACRGIGSNIQASTITLNVISTTTSVSRSPSTTSISTTSTTTTAIVTTSDPITTASAPPVISTTSSPPTTAPVETTTPAVSSTTPAPTTSPYVSSISSSSPSGSASPTALSSSSTSPTTTASASSGNEQNIVVDRSSSPPIAAIAAGAAGGALAVIVLVLLFWYCRRRHRKRSNSQQRLVGVVDMVENEAAEGKIVPFGRADSGMYGGAADMAYNAHSAQQQPLLGSPDSNRISAGGEYQQGVAKGYYSSGSPKEYHDPYESDSAQSPDLEHPYADSPPQAWPARFSTSSAPAAATASASAYASAAAAYAAYGAPPARDHRSSMASSTRPLLASEHGSPLPNDSKVSPTASPRSPEYSPQPGPSSSSFSPRTGAGPNWRQSTSGLQSGSARSGSGSGFASGSEAQHADVEVFHHQDAGPAEVSGTDSTNAARGRIELPPSYEAANR